MVNSVARPARKRVEIGIPNGIRTRVAAVKGRSPWPLDDRDVCGTPERRYQSRGQTGKPTGARDIEIPGEQIVFHPCAEQTE